MKKLSFSKSNDFLSWEKTLIITFPLLFFEVICLDAPLKSAETIKCVGYSVINMFFSSTEDVPFSNSNVTLLVKWVHACMLIKKNTVLKNL